MANSKRKTFSGILIIIFLISFFHYIGWLRPIESFLRTLIIPGSDAIYDWSVSINEDEVEQFESREDLVKAYTNLKIHYLENKVDQTNLNLLIEENKELRKELNFFDKYREYSHVGGDVVGMNIDPVGSTLIINKGMEHGIKVGNPVVAYNGVIIGKILKVEKKISIVRLLNDNQSKLAATVMNKDKSIGMIEGGYGISIRLNFIPQNEEIQIGDTVITSGLEETVPRGLLIGVVEAIEKEPYQPFQRAIVSQIMHFNKLSVVSIITDF